MFALASICHVCTLMYGIFGVKEPSTFVDGTTKADSKVPDTTCAMFADFFDKTHVVDTFRVVFKDGPRKRRIRVITLIVALMVLVGPMYGEMAVMYLFTRYRFNWSELDFSVFSTYTMVTSLFGTYTLVVTTGFWCSADNDFGVSQVSSKQPCLVFI